MTDTASRMTVVTPDGEFPAGDPRAMAAIAAYVRSEAVRDLGQRQIDQVNAALVLHPQEGLCIACQRRLPLFIFDCTHWEIYGFDHRHALWLCTRCGSHAAELAEDGGCICKEMTYQDYDGFDPFTAPAPGTQAWKLAHGPLGKITHYAPTETSQP